MQRLQLPDSPAGFAEATWDDLRPYFETLATMPGLQTIHLRGAKITPAAFT